MKKRRLKFKPYLLVLGLLWIPCNVFAGPTSHSGIELIATNVQGNNNFPTVDTVAAIAPFVAADINAIAGVTIDGFGNVTANAWQMGNFQVGPQPAPNLNIYKPGTWETYRPGVSFGNYTGSCTAGSCACGSTKESCLGIAQCTDSCSGHLVVFKGAFFTGTTPVREPGCITRGGYSILARYEYGCVHNGAGTCGIHFTYTQAFPVVMKAMGHQDNTDWYYENRYINQEYGGLIRNIYCNRGGPKRCKPSGGPVLLHTGTCENWIYPKVANTYVNPTTSSSNAVNVDTHMEV